MENFSEEEICTHLRENPDMMYVTPDGHKLYVYMPVNDRVMCIIVEESLNGKTSEELNRFLQDFILDLNK